MSSRERAAAGKLVQPDQPTFMPLPFADTLRLFVFPIVTSLLWLCLLCLPIAAQYKFDHWTVNDGLPQNTVNAIVQTHDGYLWLATNDGLARFDGMRFTVFNHGNTPGVGGNRFTSLYEDREGTLWVGSEGALTRYRDGRFVSYTVNDGVPEDEIARIEEDEHGNLWLSGRKKSLSRSWEGRFIRFDMTECLPGHILEQSPRNGLWWSYDNRGLHFFHHGRWFTVVRQDLPDSSIVGSNQDQYGAIWLHTAASRSDRIKVPFAVAPGGRQNGGGIHEDRKGNRWLSPHHNSRLRREWNGVIESIPAVTGLGMTFYEDQEGLLWIGTDNGLYRARKIGISTLTHKDGLFSDLIYSVLQGRTGTIWIGAWGGGVTRYENGRFTNFFFTNPADLYGTKVTSLYEDRAGAIWIGMMGGMNRFKDGRLTRFSDQHGLAEAWATYQDRGGDFWFATTTGLTRFRDGGFTTYTTRDGLPYNDVKVILEDRSGALWIGTYGGLARWQDGRFTAWTENDGLSGNRIRCLYEDGDGALWIGTYDGGLTRLKNGRFTRYTMREGLFGNGVFQILEDGSDNFWMSCNQGIFRVRRQELNDFAVGRIASITSTGYGLKDGMLNAECNGGRQPAGWRMHDGKLWFATMGGLVILDPAALPGNPLPPPVVIEECRLNQAPASFASELRILPEHDNLEIQYTANSFIKPEQIKFKYKLAGLDPNWIEAGNRRTAYYSYVPPGEYTFTVLAANSDGVWNEQGQSLKIIVVPPYWRRWWFLALTGAGVFGGTAFAVRRRFSRLHREAARQQMFSRQLIESQEHERQRFASELHDSLSQDLILIRNWAQQGVAQLAQSSPGRQQLLDISARSAQALAGVKEIIYNLRPHLLEEVKLSGAIKIMFRKASSSSGIAFTAEVAPEADGLSPEMQINLYRIVQECVNNIIKHSQATEAQLILRQEDGNLLLTLRDNGRGFDSETRTVNGRPGSLGLTSIAERARMLGGEHEIRSRPGEGTTITVKLSSQEMPNDQ